IEQFPEGSVLEIVTDSQYLVDTMTKWLASWKARGWKRTATQEPKNLDLLKALDAAVAVRRVGWRWVRGHAGDTLNEVVDTLAREEATAI
ncbi:RNase H family protein, partial [Streptomyces sp. URMC 126]|uniref:RNase H family protein n=1 Tax=Streptomyces sp. URMC 126 TaxID=3423401 RepID=UPI003F1CF21F